MTKRPSRYGGDPGVYQLRDMNRRITAMEKKADRNAATYLRHRSVMKDAILDLQVILAETVQAVDILQEWVDLAMGELSHRSPPPSCENLEDRAKRSDSVKRSK